MDASLQHISGEPVTFSCRSREFLIGYESDQSRFVEYVKDFY